MALNNMNTSPDKGAPSKVWAIAGGKGGTGKSFVTSNVGSCLAKKGKDVILIDADLGGANLHSLLGVKQPEASLEDFFNKKVPLKDTVRIHGNGSGKIGLVTGDIHSLESGRIKHTQNQKLFRQIRRLSADHILIDLGAGSHFSTLDSFLLADKKIVVIVPEITSIENMYQFIKTALFRKLHSSFNSHSLKYQFHNTWKERDAKNIKNINQFMDCLSKTSAEASDIIAKELQDFVIDIIVNQVRNDEDIKTGRSVQSVLLKYLGINSSNIGHIEYDDAVWNSIRAKNPVINASPSSQSALGIEKVTENLIRGIH